MVCYYCSVWVFFVGADLTDQLCVTYLIADSIVALEGNIFNIDARIFRAVHGGREVEIVYVKAGKFGPGRENTLLRINFFSSIKTVWVPTPPGYMM